MTMLNKTKTFLKRLAGDDRGLTAVEYAVLGAVVVGAIVALNGSFQTALAGAFTSLFTQINAI